MSEIDTRWRRSLPGLAYPDRYLHELSLELTVRFDGTFNAETVERYVLESYTALLRTATVKAHLASRVIRFATDRLTALAQAKGAITHDVPEAVFLANRVVVLSKGRVLDQVKVDLPRPRVWDELIEDDTFKKLSAQVLHMVRSA